jgi:probable addiction module antidote protein
MTDSVLIEDEQVEFDPAKVAALPIFDVAEHLDSPGMLAAYLSEFFAEGDIAMIMSALSDASRARGMARVAEDAGLAGPALYKAMKGTQPRLETVIGVLRALGLRLAVEPIPADTDPDTAHVP